MSEVESFKDWIFFGVDGDTFIGKPVSYMGDKSVGIGKETSFKPCYRITIHAIPLQQKDSRGNVIGVSLTMQQFVASPANLAFDVEMTAKPSWIIYGSDPATAEAISEYVSGARKNQNQIRVARSGLSI